MGYTDTIWGSAAPTIVARFLNYVGNDHTMAWTWYQANLGTPGADRWRILYRENCGVHNYRPSNIPSKALASHALPADDVQIINKTVSVASSLLDDSLKLSSDFVALESDHYAITESTEQVAEDFRIQHELLAKTSITETEAMAIASEYLGESLPEDAVLEYGCLSRATVRQLPMQFAIAVHSMVSQSRAIMRGITSSLWLTTAKLLTAPLYGQKLQKRRLFNLWLLITS